MLAEILFVFLICSILLNGYFYLRRHMYAPDGDVVITHKPDGKTLFSLELNDDPIDFHRRDLLIFKVVEHVTEVEGSEE